MAGGVATTNSEEALVAKLRFEVEGLKDIIDQYKAAMQEVSVYFGEETAKEIKNNLAENSPKTTKAADEKKKEEDEKTKKLLGGMSEGLDKLSTSGISLLKGVFGFIQDIFEQIKKSSPLLQAVEQLFNLAWQLFFMPIGNKLGEILIPAVIQMVDDVMAIWDMFEGKSLGEMMKIAIKEGITMLSTFLISIGDELKDEVGIVGSIGKFLTFIGTFLQNKGEELLNTLLGFAQFVLEHFKELIATIVAFKVASTGLQITQILTTAAASVKADIFGLGAMGVAAVGITASAAAGYIAGTAVAGMFADGGYVPSTPGGQLAVIGEGGEGEYIIPESKMGQVGGGNYTINVFSYSTEETKRLIKEVISEEVSMSRLRSGF